MGCRQRVLLIALALGLTLTAGSVGGGELTFSEDARGPYASYRLAAGETVWTHVVRRFTSRADDVSDAETSRRVLERSGLSDERRIPNNAEIKIPIELLAPEHQPEGSVQPERPLAGVVVILDAGHGGVDTGARGRNGVYEDEVVYDIMCRVKRLLEQEMGATVHVTIRDKSRGFAVTAKRSDFPRDRDEYIQSTPPYQNLNVTVGLHLRWYVANALYRRALDRGVAPERVVFTSFHADDLAPSLRGATIYIPGARYCRGRYGKSGRPYTLFAEVGERPEVAFTRRERARSEQLSRRFAETLVSSLRGASIMVLRRSPVRDHIVRRSSFVPAVLRYNAVPTKVLVECGNLSNWRDRHNLGDPTFREKFARTYVEALKRLMSRAR